MRSDSNKSKTFMFPRNLMQLKFSIEIRRIKRNTLSAKEQKRKLFAKEKNSFMKYKGNQ